MWTSRRSNECAQAHCFENKTILATALKFCGIINHKLTGFPSVSRYIPWTSGSSNAIWKKEKRGLIKESRKHSFRSLEVTTLFPAFVSSQRRAYLITHINKDDWYGKDEYGKRAELKRLSIASKAVNTKGINYKTNHQTWRACNVLVLPLASKSETHSTASWQLSSDVDIKLGFHDTTSEANRMRLNLQWRRNTLLNEWQLKRCTSRAN